MLRISGHLARTISQSEEENEEMEGLVALPGIEPGF
jgi:hypothetical protein